MRRYDTVLQREHASDIAFGGSHWDRSEAYHWMSGHCYGNIEHRGMVQPEQVYSSNYCTKHAVNAYRGMPGRTVGHNDVCADIPSIDVPFIICD